jgi:hypothetical protein
MPSAPTTAGLSLNLGSSTAFGTTITSRWQIACVQNVRWRGVSRAPNPTCAFIHWRSRSTIEISAVGTSHTCASTRASSS